MRALTWLSLLPVLFALDDGLLSVVTVHGASMQPTLNPSPISLAPPSRDVVLVWKLGAASLSSYPHGAVVVARSPYNERRSLVKRLVAKEGDWLLTPAPTAADTAANPAGKGEGEGVELIGRGRVWLEGDNAARSGEDSREYGQFPAALLQGRVVAVVWPWHRRQWLTPSLQQVGGRERLVNRQLAVQ